MGKYELSTSEVDDVNFAAWTAFDGSTNGNCWRSIDNFDTSTGEYTGLKDVNYQGNTINGEWLQIKMPTSIYLYTYDVKVRSNGTSNNEYPIKWNLLGLSTSCVKVDISL